MVGALAGWQWIGRKNDGKKKKGGDADFGVSAADERNDVSEKN